MPNTLTTNTLRPAKQDFETPEYWGAKCSDPCDGCDRRETFRLHETGAILCRSCFDIVMNVDEEETPVTPEVDALLNRSIAKLLKRGRPEH